MAKDKDNAKELYDLLNDDSDNEISDEEEIETFGAEEEEDADDNIEDTSVDDNIDDIETFDYDEEITSFDALIDDDDDEVPSFDDIETYSEEEEDINLTDFIDDEVEDEEGIILSDEEGIILSDIDDGEEEIDLGSFINDEDKSLESDLPPSDLPPSDLSPSDLSPSDVSQSQLSENYDNNSSEDGTNTGDFEEEKNNLENPLQNGDINLTDYLYSDDEDEETIEQDLYIDSMVEASHEETTISRAASSTLDISKLTEEKKSLAGFIKNHIHETKELFNSYDPDDNSQYSINVDGKNYVAGLSWFLVGPTKKLAHEIDETKRHDEDLVCVIKEAANTLFAPASSKNGIYKGSVSLAAKALSYFSSTASLVAAFKLSEDKYWIFATSDFNIRNGSDDSNIPNGDAIIVGKDKAIAVFLDRINSGHSNEIYAPNDWNIENTKEPPSLSLITSTPKTHAFSKIDTKKTYINVFLNMFLVLLITLGMLRIYDIATRKPEPKKVIKQKPKDSGIIFSSYSLPSSVLEACTNYIPQTKIAIAGWNIKDSECNENKAVTRYDQDYGDISYVKYALNKENNKLYPTFSDNGKVVVISKDIKNIKTRTLINKPSQGEVEGYLTETLSNFGIIVNFNRGKMASLPGASDVPGLKFNFTTEESPKIWGPVLDKINGIVVSLVKYNIGAKNYTIEGLVYTENSGRKQKRK